MPSQPYFLFLVYFLSLINQVTSFKIIPRSTVTHSGTGKAIEDTKEFYSTILFSDGTTSYPAELSSQLVSAFLGTLNNFTTLYSCIDSICIQVCLQLIIKLQFLREVRRNRRRLRMEFYVAFAIFMESFGRREWNLGYPSCYQDMQTITLHSFVET